MAERRGNIEGEGLLGVAGDSDYIKAVNFRLKVAFCVGLVIFLLALSVVFVSKEEEVQKNYIYPYPYREIVTRYSLAYGLDSALVAAVIHAESAFEKDAQSPVGAEGLMQLMPDTSKWIAGRLGEEHRGAFDEEINIRYGSWYLAMLLKEFRGNEVLALAAYNAGPGNVHKWMRNYGWKADFRDPEKIPFRETREYVKRVLREKMKYKVLYP